MATGRTRCCTQIFGRLIPLRQTGGRAKEGQSGTGPATWVRSKMADLATEVWGKEGGGRCKPRARGPTPPLYNDYSIEQDDFQTQVLKENILCAMSWLPCLGKNMLSSESIAEWASPGPTETYLPTTPKCDQDGLTPESIHRLRHSLHAPGMSSFCARH